MRDTAERTARRAAPKEPKPSAVRKAPLPSPSGAIDSVRPEDLVIDPEIRALVPPHTEAERALLEESLKAEGCRESLVARKENKKLVDGFTRLDICTANNIPFSVMAIDFPSDEAMRAWIVRRQLGRRNLIPFTRAELVLTAKNAVAGEARQRMLRGVKADPTKNFSEGETREILARMAGMSHPTLHKVETLLAKADKETLNALRRGETSIDGEFKRIGRRRRKKAPETRRWTFTAPIEAAKTELLAEFAAHVANVFCALGGTADDYLSFETAVAECAFKAPAGSGIAGGEVEP